MLTQEEEIRFKKGINELAFCKSKRIQRIKQETNNKKWNSLSYSERFDIIKGKMKLDEAKYNYIWFNHLKSLVEKDDITDDMIVREEEFEELRNNYYKSYAN